MFSPQIVQALLASVLGWDRYKIETQVEVVKEGNVRQNAKNLKLNFSELTNISALVQRRKTFCLGRKQALWGRYK